MTVSKYVALRRQRLTYLNGDVIFLEPGDELLETDLHPIEIARMVLYGWIRLKPIPKKPPKGG